MQEEISSTPNLTVLEGSVDDLYVVGGAEAKEVMGIYMGELLCSDLDLTPFILHELCSTCSYW